MDHIDTHCHIHDVKFFTDEAANRAYIEAIEAGVSQLLCIGTSVEDSRQAITFASRHSKNCRASVGIHPHDATDDDKVLKQLAALLPHPMVAAIGECGLDFHYNDCKQGLTTQEKTLRFQIELALKYNLPLSFHVRSAYDDFWPILDDYKNIRGVLHSFTDSPAHLEKALQRGLYIGINGIATFTTKAWQREMFKSIPLKNIVVETDAPFLTPVDKRGTINVPKNVIFITSFMAELRGEDVRYIAKSTTANARILFGL